MKMSRNRCFLPYESPNIVLVPTSSNNVSTNCTANGLSIHHNKPRGENFAASPQGIVENTNFTSTSNDNYFSNVNGNTVSVNPVNTMDNFGVNPVSLWTNQFGSIENIVEYPVPYLQQVQPTQLYSTFCCQGYSYTNIKPNAIMYPYATTSNIIYINQDGNTEKEAIKLCHKINENTNSTPHTNEDISPKAHNCEGKNKKVNLKMNENNTSEITVNLKQNMDTNLFKNDKNNMIKERMKETKTSKHLKLSWKRHCQNIKGKIKKEIEGSKDLKTKLHAQWKSILRSEYNKFVKKFYESALLKSKNKTVLSRDTRSSKLLSIKNSNTETKNKQSVSNKIKSKIIKPSELNPGYINNRSKHTNVTKSVVKPTKNIFLRSHNYKTTLDENFDLRTKLSPKLSPELAYSSNTRYISRKRPREGENLAKTVDQDSKIEKKLPVITEPKSKKRKKIKLIINVVREDSENDLSDTDSDNSGSNQDLSFLDDFNIDDIIESLDCHSSTNENKIKTKEELDRTIKKNRNNYIALSDINEGLIHYYTNIKPENMDILIQQQPCTEGKEIKDHQTILIQGNISNNDINEFSDNTNSLRVKNTEATVLDNLKSEKADTEGACNTNLSNKNLKSDLKIQPESDNKVEITLCLEKNIDELILSHETYTTHINKTNGIKHKNINENNEKNIEGVKSVLTDQLNKDIIPKKRQNCRNIKCNYENSDKNISMLENNTVQSCILNEIRYDQNNMEMKSREKKENPLSFHTIDDKSYNEIIHQIYDLTETDCDTILIPDNHDNIQDTMIEEKSGIIIYEQNIRNSHSSLNTTNEIKKNQRDVETRDSNIKKLNIETAKTNVAVSIKTDLKVGNKGSVESTDKNYTSNKTLPKKQLKDPQNIPMEITKTNAERSVKTDLKLCENKVKESEKSTGEGYTSNKALPKEQLKDPSNIPMETTKINAERSLKTDLKLSENKVKGSEKSTGEGYISNKALPKEQLKDPSNIPMETTKIHAERSLKTDLKLSENKVKGSEKSTGEGYTSNKALPKEQLKDPPNIPMETTKINAERSLKTDLKLSENKVKGSEKSTGEGYTSNKALPKEQLKDPSNIPMETTKINAERSLKTDSKLSENKVKGSEKSTGEGYTSNKALPKEQLKDPSNIPMETTKINAERSLKTDSKLSENKVKGSEKSTGEGYTSNKALPKEQLKDPSNIPMETTKINAERSLKTDSKLSENKVKGSEKSTGEGYTSNKALPKEQVKDPQNIPIETSKTKTELSVQTDLKLCENKDKLSVKSIDENQISNKFTLSNKQIKGSQNILIDMTTKNYEVLVKTDLKLGENKDNKSTCENQVSNKFKEKLPHKQVKHPMETSKLNAETSVKTDLKLGENINKGSEKSSNEHHISNNLQQIKEISKQVENLSALEKEFVVKLERKMFGVMNVRYTIDSLIRNGKFSKIYKCTNSKNENYVVKILNNVSDRLIRGVYKERMLTKLQKYNDSNYLNIVYLLNSFNMTGYWCFLMEYYPKNLEEALQENKKCFHINLVQVLTKQLVDAVTILTNWKIIHTDIKPKHILLNNSNDKLKLCGFDDSNYIFNLKIMPNTGTASYRAPEVILGFTADYGIDVWSMALVIFEMATGEKLFPGKFNNDILYKQICTLGLIPYDMLEASVYKKLHFAGTAFMRKVGCKGEKINIIQNFNKNRRLNNKLFESYKRDWQNYATKQEVFEDNNKLKNLHQLLEQMLNMDPRYRLPITFVDASEFIQNNFIFY